MSQNDWDNMGPEDSEDTTRVFGFYSWPLEIGDDQVLEQTISFLQQFWVPSMLVIQMEESGQSVTEHQENVRLLLVLPVLRAQSLGKRPWCGHCWKLAPQFASVHKVPAVRLLLQRGRSV